jgi:ankyrin repeat protein
MRVLISGGAGIDIQNRDGVTALMMAARSFERAKESVELLLEAGADVNIRDHRNESAADKVRASKSSELTSLLRAR